MTTPTPTPNNHRDIRRNFPPGYFHTISTKNKTRWLASIKQACSKLDTFDNYPTDPQVISELLLVRRQLDWAILNYAELIKPTIEKGDTDAIRY